MYILISDVGLNGYVIHGVYNENPSRKTFNEAALEAARYTGYANTDIEERELEEKQ